MYQILLNPQYQHAAGASNSISKSVSHYSVAPLFLKEQLRSNKTKTENSVSNSRINPFIFLQSLIPNLWFSDYWKIKVWASILFCIATLHFQSTVFLISYLLPAPFSQFSRGPTSSFRKDRSTNQRFVQATLMSVRQHKKLNLLIEFSNSILVKFYFKVCWRRTCIQNKLAYQVSSILNKSP